MIPPPPGAADQRAFLQPVATIDFTFDFDAGDRRSPSGRPDLSLPNDPELEGVVILVQYAVLLPGGQDFVVSDVFGSRIEGVGQHNGSAAARSGGSGSSNQRTWPTMSREDRQRATRAMRAWLGEVGIAGSRGSPGVYHRVQELRRRR